jgi:DNA invertase Pin-like site-specific DNA recombinase
LIVAKLDRLARNVAFISRLMESGVDFVAVDMPQANRFTVHILAAVAEHEREMITQRTKAALQVAKARGVKLGRPNLTDEARAKGRERSRHVRAQAAEARACLIQGEIEAIQRGGVTSLRGIATALNERGIPAARGGRWQANQVRLVLQKFPTAA